MRVLFIYVMAAASFFIFSCSSEKTEKISEAEKVSEVASQQVIMVCNHGAVKSVMAMDLFNKEAEKRGLKFRAISRGLDLYEAIPPKIAGLLEADGFNTASFKPRELTKSDVSNSIRVVSIGADLSTFHSTASGQIVQWNDIPPASVDFKTSQAAMLVRINELLNELDKT